MAGKKPSPPQTEETAGNSTQLLTLSLFIVLLAFFIVLSSTYGFDRNKVEEAMDSINNAFGAQIFLAANRAPSLAEDDAQSDGSGFASVQDFRAHMQDNFQGFEISINDRGEGEMEASLRVSEDDFYRHFKFIARSMILIQRKAGRHDVGFLITQQSSDPYDRRKGLNLSKMALRIKGYGVPVSLLNIAYEQGAEEIFKIHFLFTEDPS